jgi:hypothetical protein
MQARNKRDALCKEYLNVGLLAKGTQRYIPLPYLLTYLLTELSPSWGAANCADPQEPPSILWNPEVQYRVHKSLPLVPILSHIHRIHSIPSYLSKIHFNIVLYPTAIHVNSHLVKCSIWLARSGTNVIVTGLCFCKSPRYEISGVMET